MIDGLVKRIKDVSPTVGKTIGDTVTDVGQALVSFGSGSPQEYLNNYTSIEDYTSKEINKALDYAKKQNTSLRRVAKVADGTDFLTSPVDALADIAPIGVDTALEIVEALPKTVVCVATYKKGANTRAIRGVIGKEVLSYVIPFAGAFLDTTLDYYRLSNHAEAAIAADYLTQKE